MLLRPYFAALGLLRVIWFAPSVLCNDVSMRRHVPSEVANEEGDNVYNLSQEGEIKKKSIMNHAIKINTAPRLRNDVQNDSQTELTFTSKDLITGENFKHDSEHLVIWAGEEGTAGEARKLNKQPSAPPYSIDTPTYNTPGNTPIYEGSETKLLQLPQTDAVEHDYSSVARTDSKSTPGREKIERKRVEVLTSLPYDRKSSGNGIATHGRGAGKGKGNSRSKGITTHGKGTGKGEGKKQKGKKGKNKIKKTKGTTSKGKGMKSPKFPSATRLPAPTPNPSAFPRTERPHVPPTSSPILPSNKPTAPNQNPSEKPTAASGNPSENPSNSPTIDALAEFDLSLCESYNVGWLIDLGNSCGVDLVGPNCQCTDAEERVLAGQIVCAGLNRSVCPINCETCSICLPIVCA